MSNLVSRTFKTILFVIGAVLASILFEWANHKLAFLFSLPRNSGIMGFWLVEETIFTAALSLVGGMYYLACIGLNYIKPFKKAMNYILIPIFALFHIIELCRIINYAIVFSSISSSAMWTLIYVFIILLLQGFYCYAEISDMDE